MTATVFAEIHRELERAGLADRLQLFLLPDPEWVPPNPRDGAPHQELQRRPKPVLVALPKAVQPDDSTVRQSLSSRLVKLSSLVMSVAAAWLYSVRKYALNPTVFDAVVHEQNVAVLTRWCSPIFLGVLAIQAVHEMAHRVVARQRGIHIGLPLLIPSAQVGTLGCITPLRSFPPDRSALLDFALSGPLSAMALSIMFMMVGCYKTVHASAAKLAMYPFVTVALLKTSFLSGSMLTFLLPKVMMLPLSQPIPIHREYRNCCCRWCCQNTLYCCSHGSIGIHYGFYHSQPFTWLVIRACWRRLSICCLFFAWTAVGRVRPRSDRASALSRRSGRC